VVCRDGLVLLFRCLCFVCQFGFYYFNQIVSVSLRFRCVMCCWVCFVWSFERGFVLLISLSWFGF